MLLHTLIVAFLDTVLYSVHCVLIANDIFRRVENTDATLPTFHLQRTLVARYPNKLDCSPPFSFLVI